MSEAVPASATHSAAASSSSASIRASRPIFNDSHDVDALDDDADLAFLNELQQRQEEESAASSVRVASMSELEQQSGVNEDDESKSSESMSEAQRIERGARERIEKKRAAYEARRAASLTADRSSNAAASTASVASLSGMDSSSAAIVSPARLQKDDVASLRLALSRDAADRGNGASERSRAQRHHPSIELAKSHDDDEDAKHSDEEEDDEDVLADPAELLKRRRSASSAARLRSEAAAIWRPRSKPTQPQSLTRSTSARGAGTSGSVSGADVSGGNNKISATTAATKQKKRSSNEHASHDPFQYGDDSDDSSSDSNDEPLIVSPHKSKKQSHAKKQKTAAGPRAIVLSSSSEDDEKERERHVTNQHSSKAHARSGARVIALTDDDDDSEEGESNVDTVEPGNAQTPATTKKKSVVDFSDSDEDDDDDDVDLNKLMQSNPKYAAALAAVSSFQSRTALSKQRLAASAAALNVDPLNIKSPPRASPAPTVSAPPTHSTQHRRNFQPAPLDDDDNDEQSGSIPRPSAPSPAVAPVSAALPPPASQSVPASSLQPHPSSPLSFFIRSNDGSFQKRFKVLSNMTFSVITAKLMQLRGGCRMAALTYRGRRVEPQHTPADMAIREGDTIMCNFVR